MQLSRTNLSRLLVALILLSLAIAYFVLDLHQYLSAAYFNQERDEILLLYAQQPVATILIFAAVYISVTALSLPGAAALTVIAGAIFGLWIGLVIVSFASTIGASIAFLLSRFLLKDLVQRVFANYLKDMNAGFARLGAYYLFTLRLVPAVPYVVINIVMGLVPIKLRTFYWVSQLAMLPGTFVYVNAGRKIRDIDSLAEVLSFDMLLSLALVGFFPLLARLMVTASKRSLQMRSVVKPRSSTEINLFGVFLGLSVGFFIALMALATNQTSNRHSFADMMLFRMSWTCIVLLPVVWKHIPTLWQRRSLFIWPRAIFGAGGAIAGFYVLSHSSITVATVLADFAPIWVLILAALLGEERLNRLQLLGVLIPSVTILCTQLIQTQAIPIDVFAIGMLGALCSGFAMLSLRRASQTVQVPLIVFTLSFAAALAALPLSDHPEIVWGANFEFGLLAIVATSLIYQLTMTFQYRFIAASIAVILNKTSIIWALFFDLFLLDHHITRGQLVMIAAMIVGIFLLYFGQAEKEKQRA